MRIKEQQRIFLKEQQWPFFYFNVLKNQIIFRTLPKVKNLLTVIKIKLLTIYFPVDNTKISDEEFFIASLILRHLQLLQFNAHEIFELEVASNGRIDDSQTIFIGGALFPTLALFNHSCDPDTIR